MTLKEQIERERMYREAVKQMVIEQTPAPKDLGLWKPGCEPNYATVKADLK